MNYPASQNNSPRSPRSTRTVVGSGKSKIGSVTNVIVRGAPIKPMIYKNTKRYRGENEAHMESIHIFHLGYMEVQAHNEGIFTIF